MAALATADDVRAALRRDLTETEALWVDGLLLEASDLVVGHLNPYPVPSPTPDPIVRVVATMAAAVLKLPANILPETQSLSADAYSVSFAAGATSPGPYLTGALKQRLAPYRVGVVAISLGSERA